ncbi:uncharacterized protein MYCFIDRAFT_197912 [Pseudocercospora fijiensis CIRAD86]|uniref:Transcriptional coactivator HFI1/ADA1 n=1 Tax=Pseudocercospora fijiensis (strain CIRAD86) TaxID=383855 RepID=M3AVB3_PSEFD|nr:uncharacterized protein MYCFIDRAFT_197912 [Pseudocercospora fijiensis CIRAD86]EME81098.1 hypothetical protein MYCFIDRAFT_197912 [Pseudocercospora fijiensis CIRAD86]
MDPADLSLSTISPNLTKAQPVGLVAKNGVAGAASAMGRAQVERINVEPIYTQLKSALGDNWAEYKTAFSEFVRGCINQAELSWVLQPILSSAPSTTTSGDSSKGPPSILILHNQLLTAIYANTLRDPPPTEVAPWVVATDKPTSTSKNAAGGSGANDKAEERLKKEIMTIGPRDRARIKGLKDPSKAVNDGFREALDYSTELTIRPSGAQTLSTQAEPQSATGAGPSGGGASGLARNNFEVEIHRLYAQPLAAEQLEFPAQADMQNRIEPICYREGLTGGVQQGQVQPCAELVEQAAEVFMKGVLGALLGHARSNAAGKDGIQTHKFKKQLRKEEDDADRGVLQRNAGGLLPVEMEMMAKTNPLNMQDLRLGVGLQDHYLKHERFLGERVMLSHYPDLVRKPTPNGLAFGNGHIANGIVNGDKNGVANDEMDIDERFDRPGAFQAGTRSDYDSIMAALDECAAPG